MKIKKAFAVGLSAVLAMSTFGYNSWAADKNGKNIPEENYNFVGGYVESELDGNTPVYDAGYSMFRLSSNIPDKFPDSIDTLKSTYPASRDQNPYGTCWAFSSIGLAEFDLISDESADRNIDLSELGLAYFTYNFVTDPLGGTVGDTAKYYNKNATDKGYSTYLNKGGNYQFSSRRMAQWVGATENDVPYSNAYNTIDNGLDGKYAYSYNNAHLHNAYQINISGNTKGVKEAIMEHGAVGAMYYHIDNYTSNLVYNNELGQYTYYDTDITGGGHCVMIVGWDDSFSKDYFGGIKPSNDGAWLVRNSWGTYCDYFWMSYETKSLIDTAWVFDFVANDGYDNNYQLDGGLRTDYKTTTENGVDIGNIGANVFTTQKKDDIDYEILKAVSISMTQVANVQFTVEIYTNLTDPSNPVSGTKQESATTTGTTNYAGLYTVELAEEVKLEPGTTFSVVVTTDKSSLDLESAYDEAIGDTTIWENRVSLSDGKSFYKSGNTFVSSYNNYCIKAFTSNGSDSEDKQKVAEAKTVVEKAQEAIIATNAITKADVQKVVDSALSEAGITDVTALVGDLTKKNATQKEAGSVKADITLTCGAETDKVEFSKSIDKLTEEETKAEESTKQDTTTETATPEETTTATPEETTTAKPAETTTAIPEETTTATPAETTTAKPAETTTATPAETTTAKPAETTTAIPAETTTAKPAETTTAKPAETTTVAPEKTTATTETTTVAPEKTTTTATETTTTASENKTSIKPVVSEDAPSVKAEADMEKLIEKSLDEKQKEIVNGGGSADIVLSVKKAADDNEADKKLIETSFKADEKMGMCLDISLLLTIRDKNGNVVESEKKVSEAKEVITVTINIPSELILTDNNKKREYKIVRVHNGIVKTVNSRWNADAKSITFDTDEFSTYAIVYTDSDADKSEVKPADSETKSLEDISKASSQAVSEAQNTESGTSTKTGDATRLMMWIMIVLLSGAGVVGIISKKRKLND